MRPMQAPVTMARNRWRRPGWASIGGGAVSTASRRARSRRSSGVSASRSSWLIVRAICQAFYGSSTRPRRQPPSQAAATVTAASSSRAKTPTRRAR